MTFVGVSGLINQWHFVLVFTVASAGMDRNIDNRDNCIFLCAQFSWHDRLSGHHHGAGAVPLVLPWYVRHRPSSPMDWCNAMVFVFSGTCAQSGLPEVDYARLDKLNLIRPPQVHICMWIYLALSVLLLISSITLLTSELQSAKPNDFKSNSNLFRFDFQSDVRYVSLKNANCFLYVWILLVVALSILDLGLGVAFGLDYDVLRVSTIEFISK